MRTTNRDDPNFGKPKIKFRIAVVGAPQVGKTTIIKQFMQGSLTSDYTPEINFDKLIEESDGTYEIELEYNRLQYIIYLEEKPIVNHEGKCIMEGEDQYLNDYDGVVYTFALDNPESYLMLQDFYNGQVAAGSLFRPRVAVANKIDLIDPDDYEDMVDLTKSVAVDNEGKFNFNGTKKWVAETMNCEYAEISGNDHSNVDEVFMMLIHMMDEKEEHKATTSSCLHKLTNIRFLSGLFLNFLSLMGIVMLGAGMYSGTKPQRPHDDNWLYVIMFFIGIFTFIPGVVGFYGVKYSSKEYLGAVITMLIPITILSMAYTTFFFIKISELEIVQNNILTEGSARVISILNVVDVLLKCISVYFTHNVYSNLKTENRGVADDHLAEHQQYKPITDIEHPLIVTKSKWRASNTGTQLTKSAKSVKSHQNRIGD
ncbi:unnamed protein product [Moneuplotes crassus]|uniref:Uncharacterized protein n=1 Tax=Euplotes crassus TaxID=5936 RepID=A0AAD1UQC5_EUPCR|nr:unnamed protein product [Moneuplotes crassus]